MKYNYKLLSPVLFVIAAHIAACTQMQPRFVQESKMETMLTGRVHVYDGDSIFFGAVEVRLNAIDAPERDQACRDRNGNFWPCGVVARDALRHLIGSYPVHCRLEGRDTYRRLLGICFAHGRDLNTLMVAMGDAIAYRHFSDTYAPQESFARKHRIGIWQDAHFTEPYYCRHFTSGHVCYEYDYITHTGKRAEQPLIGKSHAVGVPD